MNAVLRVCEFEDRLVPAVAIDTAPDAYAWTLVNTLRQNPTKFADNIQGLVNGTVASAFGISQSDPVIADLKAIISNAAVPSNYAASLSLMRSTPAAGPLAWDETLENRADIHTDWMKTDGFAHTGTTGDRVAIPGFTKNDSAPPDVWGYSGQYSWWGEDISYGYGMMRSTKSAYNTGSINLSGLLQRGAFLDTVGYMLELNSSTLGHLKNLLGRDSGSSSTLPSYNAVGIDFLPYEAPSGYEAQDGVPEAYISTHRLGLYRPNATGGFIAGEVFTDSNLNGYYDIGEEASVTINIRDSAGNGVTDTLNPGNFGAFSEYLGNGTYTVTISSGGVTLDSRSVTINNSNSWAGFALGGVGRPTLTGPIGAQTTLRPTVAWTAADQATGYQVRIDDLTTGATNLFGNVAVNGTSWSPTSDLVSGRSYRVWVRGTTNGMVGAWSDPTNFSVAVPNKYGPGGTVNDIRPTFTWGAVDGATSYMVRADDVSANLTNIFPNTIVSGTSWQPPTDLASGRSYRWQVRALNQAGLGAWTPAGSFVIAKPTLTGPASGVASLRPTFTWSAVNGATAYVVAVNDVTGNVPSQFAVRVYGTSWAPPADLVSGRIYTWHVRAVNSLNLGGWSALQALAVGRPNLSGPIGDVSGLRPTFNWSGIGWASQYQVRVDDLTTGQTGRYLVTVGGLDWTPTTDLVAGHTYRWYVRAMNANGLGMWSLSRDFRIV